MKKYSKAYCLTTIVALFGLTLWGCNRGAAPQPEPNPGPDTVLAAGSPAGKVRIAAASDLRFALGEVAERFEEMHAQCKVDVVYGASGSLFAQITNKAPFDVFLSADVEYPLQLINEGVAIADSQFSYGKGRLVVWVPNDSAIDLDNLGIRALAAQDVKKIAIANPRHAPYGRAAEAALKSLDIYDEVQDRLVFGENVSQAAQLVESGAADAGVIALSLAIAPTMKTKGRYWVVPADAYPPLEQGGVVLKAAEAPEAARAFCEFLQSSEARGILKGYGFTIEDR